MRLADELADKFTAHDVNLQRLQASQRMRILRSLKELEDELEAKIRKAAKGEETFTLLRSRVLLREVTAVISGAYDGIHKSHAKMLKSLGVYELRATAKIINSQLGVSLLSVGVSDAVVDAMLKDEIVTGVPLKSFWDQQAVSLRNKFATEMRAGIFAGETPSQLITRVRGTAKNNFKDGIMNSTRRGAEVVVRTSAQSILNDARMEVYKANEDVIEGVQASVTLDDRTTEICMARSGNAWDLDGNPLGDTDEDFPGPPPWHPNCRSTLIPVVKSIGKILNDPKLDREVEKEINKLPKATQASMDGQVAADLTYEQWLETKSEAFQREVLGDGKYELWNKGKISLRDLIDQRGRPLTLDQLRQVEA